MKKIRTLKGRVLIERTPYQPYEQTEGGIWLPASAREKPQTGRVAAVSDGSDLQVGTGALLPHFSDRTISIEGVEHELLPESDVLAELSTDETKRVR